MLGETAEQRAFRAGFNDGYEHGKNDQADHFVEVNEQLRADYARMREALEGVLTVVGDWEANKVVRIERIARAALSEDSPHPKVEGK